ncbi:MAG: carbamoyltransferase HypF [Ignavibacteriales bacterium]|nr:carbamoyltransferase HypF [Ignavibacteriales bacterium]
MTEPPSLLSPPTTPRIPGEIKRLRMTLHGAVQGVGFRPFVFRLAHELRLTGWVLNSSQGLQVEVEGPKSALDTFLARVHCERPSRSLIQCIEQQFLDPVGFESFLIRTSDEGGEKTTLVLPDIAVCPDCLHELFDPANRRYLYPFTNCTNCGPRFTIIESVPYDRPNTTMRKFPMCPRCREEYDDPRDRRFHAQPNACPVCGPHVEFWDEHGTLGEKHQPAVLMAAEAIRAGRILAVKGIGGFHMMVDARNESAVRCLRERKHREEKPLALMVPALEDAVRLCEVSELEKQLLCSPEAPIVLLLRRGRGTNLMGFQTPFDLSSVAPSVAPDNPYLGIILPATPLHHILMRELGFPIVATSGNLSDEPICTDEREAVERLSGIADAFLVHNRPIARPVDDSVVRVMMGRESVLRRARGYAPLPIELPAVKGKRFLAVGGHLKNTIAITTGTNVVISQHLGDLETEQSQAAFRNAVADLPAMYESKPNLVLCDMHPEYVSSKEARKLGVEVEEVQHHYAHVASCMAENGLDGEVLGISWDGTGFGPDGTIWGGEFLLTNETSFKRVGTFRSFPLPGGEKAVREPRRTALGILYEMLGEKAFGERSLPTLQAFSEEERTILRRMLENGFHTPRTSSVGRLFDAVSSIIGQRHRVSFEGQAAMELEFLAMGVSTKDALEIAFGESDGRCVVDWEPMLQQLIAMAAQGKSARLLAAMFHNTLVEIIVQLARYAGQQRVVLTGGCFQNKILCEEAIHRLTLEGFWAFWHYRVPPTDGGIALGQIYAAVKRRSNGKIPFPAFDEEVAV